MSMLTPSGMGGKYRVTGTAYPRMRRPRRRGRIVAAVVASVVVLGLFGWGAVQLFHVFRGDDGDSQASGTPQNPPSCAPVTPAKPTGKPVPLPQPSGVTVNVLNATARGGLAKTTADELARRGFKVSRFGNAQPPYDKKVTQSALIVAGPAGAAAAREAGTQVVGSAVKIDPARKGAGVDLLIGNGFSALASPADAAKARGVAANPPPPKASCRPKSASPSAPASGAGSTPKTKAGASAKH